MTPGRTTRRVLESLKNTYKGLKHLPAFELGEDDHSLKNTYKGLKLHNGKSAPSLSPSLKNTYKGLKLDNPFFTGRRSYVFKEYL